MKQSENDERKMKLTENCQIFYFCIIYCRKPEHQEALSDNELFYIYNTIIALC